MADTRWTAVEHYFTESLKISDPVLDEVLVENAKSGLPSIDVAPNQGKLLHLMAQLCESKKILEIGTLGGYSTIWLARALKPGGVLVTLEADPKHAAVARMNIARAGLSNTVDLRVGPALDTLPLLEEQRVGPFDFIFIDADKSNIPSYLEWALKLSRRGSLIVIDNVVRDGAIVDPTNSDPNIVGVRRMFDMLANEPRISATALQTVGQKGYDGFLVASVVSD